MKTYCRIQAVYGNFSEEYKTDKNKLTNLINIGKLESYRGEKGKIIYIVSKGEKVLALQSYPVTKIEPPLK